MLETLFEAYMPFTGGSTHGFGIIRKTVPEDITIYKFVFECTAGKIFFDTFHDIQVKDIQLLFGPYSLKKQFELLEAKIVKALQDNGDTQSVIDIFTKHTENLP